MITDKNIYRVCSLALIVCSVTSLGLSICLLNLDIFMGWWFCALFIFTVSFVMELFHVNVIDLICWLRDQFRSRAK